MIHLKRSLKNLPIESRFLCQPWIGRVPCKYQIMTIGGVPPLINKYHGLLIRG